MGRSVGMWLVVALLSSAGCIELEDGESGSYTSPCTGPFGDLGLCGRETGGAPPSGTPDDSDEAFTCADACEVLCSCGFCDQPGDLQDCTQSCEAQNVPQEVLDCIERERCNIEACT